jgi:hypothetical protein
MGDVMSRFPINYSGLENTIYKKAYRLEDVKDSIERVAFDVVRFKDDDNSANLWQIQSADDGDYIVAIYDPESVEKIATNDWSVVFNKISGDLQVSYKGDPLVRLAYSKLGIPRTELNKTEQYLPEKLANNKKLVSALLNELNETAKKEVLSKYPELV